MVVKNYENRSKFVRVTAKKCLVFYGSYCIFVTVVVITMFTVIFTDYKQNTVITTEVIHVFYAVLFIISVGI